MLKKIISFVCCAVILLTNPFSIRASEEQPFVKIDYTNYKTFEIITETNVYKNKNGEEYEGIVAQEGKIFFGVKDGKYIKYEDETGAYYIKSNNLSLHRSHCFQKVLTSDFGYVLVCENCGFSSFVNDTTSDTETTIQGNLFLAFKQVLLGDFDESYSLLGAIGSIMLGFVPIVGQVMDFRDLSASVIHCMIGKCDAQELAINSLAFFPLLDFLKYSDDAKVLKLFENTDPDEYYDRVLDSYKNLRVHSKGKKGLEVHHLLEKRLSYFVDVKENDFLSVTLTKAEHKVFTRRFRQTIPYCGLHCNITLDEMLEALDEIYFDSPYLKENTVNFVKSHWIN